MEETLLHALIAGGEYDRAERLLSDRLERRASPLDWRRLEAVRGRGVGWRGSAVVGGSWGHARSA